VSGFHSNISDTIAAACVPATRSGDMLLSLLSPAQPSSSSAISAASLTLGGPPLGVTFAVLGRQMAGLSTAASAGSGEGEGGSGEFSLCVGGSCDLSIFVLDSESSGHLCLGAVNSGIKFCLLPADQCSVGEHSKKVDIHPSYIYINAGRNAAFTDPHASVRAFGSALTPLLGELHPREEWLLIFQSFMESSEAVSGAKAIITPKKHKFRYLPDPEDLPAAGSLDSPLSSFSSWDMDQPDSLKQLATAFGCFESRFSTFQVAVGEDVDSMLARFHDVKAPLGVPPAKFSVGEGGFGGLCNSLGNHYFTGQFRSRPFYIVLVTVWETFTLLASFVQDPSTLQSVESLVQTLRTLTSQHTTAFQSLEAPCTDATDLLQLLSSEQETLSQIITQGGLTSSHSTPAAVTVQDFHTLEDRIIALETSMGGGVEFNTLQAQLKLIEAHLPSDPFAIGGRPFNSKADVALFVEKELSGISFSLFHDAITLLESITDGQSKKTDEMAAMYQASRVGFDEDEAMHVHSFKLLVPSLLGATKEGDKNDPKYPLPAVRDFAAWNLQDNESGVKKRIQDGMDDVSLSVTESINVSCSGNPAGSKLATEMLYQTQVFVNELCSWVDSFFLELMKTSQVPPGEAWLLVALCIRKFCDVLRCFRAPADRAASKMDSSTRTTAYLWEMIQVHREMKVIRSHNFRGHPAVAPVIMLHVFKTRMTNTAFEKLSDYFRNLDKKISDTRKKIDKVQDRLSKVEKKN